MKAYTHTQFIETLFSNDIILKGKVYKYNFRKSDMQLFEYKDGSANAYIKLEVITPRMKQLFCSDFVISVYITNIELYGPKESERQFMLISTTLSKTRAGKSFYKVSFHECQSEPRHIGPALLNLKLEDVELKEEEEEGKPVRVSLLQGVIPDTPKSPESLDDIIIKIKSLEERVKRLEGNEDDD